MAELLFRLRGVPDDEADDIRELLETHGIEFYETPPSRWGVSMEAIWLPNRARLDEARVLIEQYQQARRARVREEGGGENLLERIRRRPIQFIVYVALAGLILYLSISPFLSFGE